MASIYDHADDKEEPRREYDDELLTQISTDEHTADAPQDKDEESRRIRWLKNTKRA
jgi:hypothetical protein